MKTSTQHLHDLRYEKLSVGNGSHSIRLLVVDPAPSSASVIKCSFIHAPLLGRALYEAISYAWGSDVRDKTVQNQSGRSLPCTTSAYNSLRAVRLVDRPRTIWIDGLCINQSDKEEKAEQVAMMGNIYGNAVRTLVYLGEDDDDKFAYLVDALAGAKPIPIDDPKGLGSDRDGNIIRVHPILTMRDKLGFDPRTATLDNVTAIAYHAREILYGCPDRFPPLVGFRTWFFARPWFTRMWMMQEIALSTRVSFYFAGQELSWGCIMAFHNLVDWKSHQLGRDFYGHPLVSDRSILGTRIVENFGDDDTVGPSGMRFAHECRYLRHRNNIIDLSEEHYGQGRGPLTFTKHLMDLLCEMRHFACQDPRDRLYALISLFDAHKESLPALFEPDYSSDNTAARTFGNITRYLVSKGNLDILAAAQGLRFTDLPHLASWAADWRHPPDRQNLLMAENVKPDLKIGLPNASIPPSIPISSTTNLLADSDVLTLRGIVLGELTYVSAHPYLPSSDRTAAAYRANEDLFCRTYSTWIWWEKYAHSLIELNMTSDQLPTPEALSGRDIYDQKEILISEPLEAIPEFAAQDVKRLCQGRTFAVVGDHGISLLADRDDRPFTPIPLPGSHKVHRIPKQLSDEDWENGWVPTRASCLVPPEAEIGDLVCGIVGSELAVVFRKNQRRRIGDGSPSNGGAGATEGHNRVGAHGEEDDYVFVGMTTYWKTRIADKLPDLDWNQASQGEKLSVGLQEFALR